MTQKPHSIGVEIGNILKVFIFHVYGYKIGALDCDTVTGTRWVVLYPRFNLLHNIRMQSNDSHLLFETKVILSCWFKCAIT